MRRFECSFIWKSHKYIEVITCDSQIAARRIITTRYPGLHNLFVKELR